MDKSKNLNILLISYLSFALLIAIISASMLCATLAKYDRLEALAYSEIEDLRNSVMTSGKNEEKVERFVLRESNGMIGVFSADGKLLETINVIIKTLPAKDRQMLSEGITVSSREELFSLIQDYTS